MTYTQDNLTSDLQKIGDFATAPKSDDIFDAPQWEMARLHKALVRYWIQVQKQFTTSAPTEDAENYLGFARQWVRMVRMHHQLEEEVQFPSWDPPADMQKNRDEHAEMMVPFNAFSAYLDAVADGSETWSATKAEELAQAFLPILMHHFVEELYTLAPDALKAGGVTEESLKAARAAVAERSKATMDPMKDVPGVILHNDNASDWPPVPWQLTPEFRMPPALYQANQGWWKYSALPLKL